MFSTDNGMNTFHRLILAVLLVLVVVGLAGHILAPGAGYQHAASESTCTLHTGFLAPVFQASYGIEAYGLSIFSQGAPHALGLIAKIPHPPTI